VIFGTIFEGRIDFIAVGKSVFIAVILSAVIITAKTILPLRKNKKRLAVG
jgi:hypothetical protein